MNDEQKARILAVVEQVLSEQLAAAGSPPPPAPDQALLDAAKEEGRLSGLEEGKILGKSEGVAEEKARIAAGLADIELAEKAALEALVSQP